MIGKIGYAFGNPGVVIREDVVGQAPRAICYPGVSSCLTITCVSPAGLSGAHLTIVTTSDLIDQALLSLKSAGSNMFSAVYAVGKIAEFKARTVDERLRTRKKMSQLLRHTFNYRSGTIQFYDTVSNGIGVNIGVTKGLVGVDFCWQGDRTRVSGDTMPDLAHYTPIPAHAFVAR
jgi:hypothetical protein